MKKMIPILAALSLVACAQPKPVDDGVFRQGDMQRMFLSVPGVLVDESTKPVNPLNLDDPEQVARALQVKLNGRPDQVLYVMQMVSPTADEGIVKREIPIRVDNIGHGANMIRGWQTP